MLAKPTKVFQTHKTLCANWRSAKQPPWAEAKSSLHLSDYWILEEGYATAGGRGEIECPCMGNLTYKLINEQHISFICWLKREMESECQVAAIIALCTWHLSSGSVVSIINLIFQGLKLSWLKSYLAETGMKLVRRAIGDLFPFISFKKILTSFNPFVFLMQLKAF